MRSSCIAVVVVTAFVAVLGAGDDRSTVASDGTTPLHLAVRAGDAASVRRLLREGADAKAANRYGVTPLSLAAENGDAAIIGALLAAGAIPDPFYGTNERALQWIGEVDWLYRCAFDLNNEQIADVATLCCDGLDTIAMVWLNGRQIATRRIAGGAARCLLPSACSIQKKKKPSAVAGKVSFCFVAFFWSQAQNV